MSLRRKRVQVLRMRAWPFSLLAKDVPPYAIVGGNPAKIVRYSFDEITIRRLEQVGWWNWDVAKITRNIKAICSWDISAIENAV